jgi:hypothetical protein
MQIGEMEKEEGPKIEVVSQTKIAGGVLKKVKHFSECNQCDMTFNIFLPADEVRN